MLAAGRLSCTPVKQPNLRSKTTALRYSLVVYSFASPRVLDGSSSAPYHFNSIATQPIEVSTDDCSRIPLLDPRIRRAPLAVALELHGPRAAADPWTVGRRSPLCETSELQDVLELRYLLAGCGQIAGSTGQVEPLEVGSSVLMPLGSAACRADPGAQPLPLLPSSTDDLRMLSDLLGRLRVPPSHPFSMVSLVVLFHRSLLEDDPPQRSSTAQQAQHGAAQAAPQMAAPAALLYALDRLWGQQGAVDVAVGSGAAELPVSPAAGTAAGPVARVLAGVAGGRGFSEGGASLQQLGLGWRGGGRDGTADAHSAWAAAEKAKQLEGAGSGVQEGRQAEKQGGAGSPLQHGQRAEQRGDGEGGGGQLQQQGLIIKRLLRDLPVFELPRQTNRLALAFDPVATPQAPFVFGVETFQPGHCTTPHVHPHAHELFFILSGDGEAFCGEERMAVSPGDLVLFDPGAMHGIDVLPSGPMYCLELMLPNDQFAMEVVRAGRDVGHLQGGDMGVIAPYGCSVA